MLSPTTPSTGYGWRVDSSFEQVISPMSRGVHAQLRFHKFILQNGERVKLSPHWPHMMVSILFNS